MKKLFLLAVVGAAALTFSCSVADAGEIIGLVTKTNTNPFFVKMKEGFEKKAKEVGLTPQAYAGKFDGDNDGEVRAIEQLIAAGTRGILLVPSDSTAIVPTVKKARDAGVLVITLDTPLDPEDAADALFATDNYKAGQLIGRWAKGTLGDKAKEAKVATLDLNSNQLTVDNLRHNGFLNGYGVAEYGVVPDDCDCKVTSCKESSKKCKKSSSSQIVSSEETQGSTDGGRRAMENILQKADHVDLVYAINEPAAYGGYTVLKAAGKEKGVIFVAVDGGCQGVKWVKEGILGATSQQYPLLMAADGVQAVADYIKTGKKPTTTDTGEKLVTDKPVPGVPSITSEEAMKICWG
jgi:fructose transport system substrate-binding protein